jgi:hypothetical protein
MKGKPQGGGKTMAVKNVILFDNGTIYSGVTYIGRLSYAPGETRELEFSRVAEALEWFNSRPVEWTPEGLEFLRELRRRAELEEAGLI